VVAWNDDDTDGCDLGALADRPGVDRPRTPKALLDPTVSIDVRAGCRRPDRRVGLKQIVPDDEAD